ADPPSEQALVAAATFAKLTVDTAATLKWQQKLHTAFPADPVYHLDLADAFVENDQLDDAASTLDSLIAKTPERSQPLTLTLTRCGIDTKLGEREKASARLTAALDRHRGDRNSESTILDFAKTHFIDSVSLDILESRARRDPAEPEHAFALARFHIARGRPDDAQEAISKFVEAGNPAAPRLAGRLRQAADFFVSQDKPETAQSFAARAAEVGSDDPGALVQLAEIAFARGDTTLAVSHLEAALTKTSDPGDRITLNSRILSYLQHNFQNTVVSADDSAFRIGSLISPPSTTTPAAPADARIRNYAASTLEYAAARATAADADPTFNNVFRATWWAFRTDDSATAFRSLRQLRRLQTEPDLQTCKLTLEIASSSGLYGLSKRQLQHLVKLDPSNATSYLVRLADLEVAAFPAGPAMPSRAIAILEPLVGGGGLDTKVVESLARAYIAAGRPSEGLALWERSFATATDPAARSALLGPLTAEYLSRNRTSDAVDAYSRVIREQRDDKKRRELFAQQLSLASGNVADAVLEQLAALYRSLQNSDPLQPFWNEALARTLAKAGDTAEAFAAMKRAYYNDPDPDPGVLTELREMALELGDRTAALYFQRQLIFTSGTNAGPGEWQRLVNMLEERLDIGATDRARQRLERRFDQDPDLLSGLLDHYQKNGQDDDALRVAGQLAGLRPWDPTSQYRLGLLLRDAGKTRQAFDAFTAAIDQSPTDDAHDPGETQIVEIAHAALLSSSVQTDPFLTGSEAHRTLTLLSKLATVPKTPAVPTDPTQLQLAAVSAAAPLARELGGDILNSWQTSWGTRTTASPHAAYRALAGSGDTSHAIAIARDHLISDATEESYLRYAYALVTLHRWDELSAWISAPDALTQHHGKRQRFASFVIAGLLRDNTPRALGHSDIQNLVATGHFGPADLWSFAVAAASGRNYDKATAIAALSTPGKTPLHPTQAYSASVWNHWAGNDGSSYGHLRTSFDNPLDDPAHSNWFFKAFQQLERQTSDPAERDAITRNATSIAATHSSPLSKSLRVPRRFVDPAGFVRRLSGAPLPVPAPPSPASYPSHILFWQDAEQATTLYQTHGLDQLAAETSGAVLASIASPPDTDDDNYSRYLSFSANSLVAQLRHASHLEQQRLVSGALSAALSPEELYDLATILSNRGFPRHASGIFARLIELEPHENNFVTEFTSTCLKAGDPTPALRYFHRVLVARTLPAPKRMPTIFLATNYARFLRMAGDAESLAVFATSAPQHATPPISPTGHELPYIRALAALHLDAGDHAAALPLLHTALKIDTDSTDTITDLAETLIATGDFDAALEILDSPPARSAVLPADRSEILTSRATALDRLGRNDELLQVLVDAHTLALPTTLIEVATTAAHAGHFTAATSALELARRASDLPAERLAYATAALQLTLSEKSATPPAPQTLADRLAPTLETKNPSQDSLDPLLETLHAHAAELTPAWGLLVSAGTLQRTRTNTALAGLARLAITGTLDLPSLAAPEASTTIASTAIYHLLATGRPAEARQLLAAIDTPAPPIRLTAPVQVAVAAALGDDISLRTLYAASARGD
ncbi:MAG: tetratricopeptide repeat protein, partial [Verrucomicrobiales bacterium]|nr:tetratricopeptide repeat protein [Verrucomicrobiales bacterium]